MSNIVFIATSLDGYISDREDGLKGLASSRCPIQITSISAKKLLIA